MSGNKKKDCKAIAVQISEIKIEKNHIRGQVSLRRCAPNIIEIGQCFM